VSGSDGGVQPERTALAWQRTGLAVVLASLAVLRLAAFRGSVAGVVVGAVAGVLAVVALVLVRFGYARGVRDVSSGAGAVAMGPAATTTAAIALLAVSGLAVGLA
jgi:putative membrane protein